MCVTDDWVVRIKKRFIINLVLYFWIILIIVWNIALLLQGLVKLFGDWWKNTKIIFITHHWWNALDVSLLRTWLWSLSPLLVEDCSYGYGAYLNGKHVWGDGDMSIFPLNYEKLVFTGQGCIVTTNNRLMTDCLKDCFTYSFQAYSSITESGEMVSYCSFVQVQQHTVPSKQWSYHGFVLQYHPENLRKLPLSWLLSLLQAEGVEVRMAEDSIIECLNDKGEYTDLNASNISKWLLFLPSFYDWYTHKDIIDQYIAAFRKIQLNLFC